MPTLFPTRVDFINIFRQCFSYKLLAPKITKLCFGFDIFWRQNIGKKSERKMLMKLTPVVNFYFETRWAFTDNEV
jgi:hypothetical protein